MGFCRSLLEYHVTFPFVLLLFFLYLFNFYGFFVDFTSCFPNPTYLSVSSHSPSAITTTRLKKILKEKPKTKRNQQTNKTKRKQKQIQKKGEEPQEALVWLLSHALIPSSLLASVQSQESLRHCLAGGS